MPTTPTPPLPARAQDWDWAQHQYETTDTAATELARQIGVTPTALVARASRNGWTRNKGKLVAQLTAEMVLAARARASEQRVERMEVIERVNAEMQAQVLATHRTDIKEARTLCTALFKDLREDVDLDLEGKSNVLRRLADSMKTLLLLERQAYGIQGVFEDTEKPSTAPVAEAATTDAVMQKFAAVLAKRMGAVEVVQNDA